MSKALHFHDDFGSINEEDTEMKNRSTSMSDGGPSDPIDVAADISNLAMSSGISKPVVQDARILDPSSSDSLVRIINQLDPASFVKLARSCRSMHTFCFSAPGIAVQFGDDRSWTITDSRFGGFYTFGERRLMIVVDEDAAEPGGIRCQLEQQRMREDERPHSLPESLLQKMMNMPFRYVIEMVHFDEELEEINASQLEVFRQYLRRFRRIDLCSVVLLYGTSDWKLFAEIAQEFRMKRFQGCDEVSTEIPDDVLRFFAANLVHLDYPEYVSDDLILATKAEDVNFNKARISLDTFKRLLEKFATGEIHRWQMGRQSPLGHSDPFRQACSEIVKVAVVENVDYIIKDPGVFYTSPSRPGEYSLLRRDGSTGRLRINPEYVKFY